jgi:hypothetical protein
VGPGSKGAPSVEHEHEEIVHEVVANVQVESESEMAASVDEEGRAVNEEVHAAAGVEVQVESEVPADANVVGPCLLAGSAAHRTVGT